MSELKETVLKITNGIVKTSGELIKSTKLSINLASEEERLKALYTEIGKKVHEIYMYGGALGAAFDEHIALVEEQEAKIRDIKDRLDAVKGAKTCAGCGKTMDRGAEFCPKCGRGAYGAATPPQERVYQDAPPVDETDVICAEDIKRCPLCGKDNDSGLKFCYHCGRAL